MHWMITSFGICMVTRPTASGYDRYPNLQLPDQRFASMCIPDYSGRGTLTRYPGYCQTLLHLAFLLLQVFELSNKLRLFLLEEFTIKVSRTSTTVLMHSKIFWEA